MKYLPFFLVSLVLGLAIIFILDYMKFNVWVIAFGFQWVTQYILPWIILYVLVVIARK